MENANPYKNNKKNWSLWMSLAIYFLHVFVIGNSDGFE